MNPICGSYRGNRMGISYLRNVSTIAVQNLKHGARSSTSPITLTTESLMKLPGFASLHLTTSYLHM
jgi:hypothetical protein